VTGHEIDKMLYKRLAETSSQASEFHSLGNDIVSLFKIKKDLKETFFSPYKIPFNQMMLTEIKKHNKMRSHQ
jgi:hypothetical protein